MSKGLRNSAEDLVSGAPEAEYIPGFKESNMRLGRLRMPFRMKKRKNKNVYKRFKSVTGNSGELIFILLLSKNLN